MCVCACLCINMCTSKVYTKDEYPNRSRHGINLDNTKQTENKQYFIIQFNRAALQHNNKNRYAI